MITHIPAGLHVPYQTLYPKQEYYIRAGSTFQPTPHSVLAGLFGRAPQPIVVPTFTLQTVEAKDDVRPWMRIIVAVSMINKGRSLAEDIFCMVEATQAAAGVCSFQTDRKDDRWSFNTDDRTCFTMILRGQILPPGAELRPVFSIALEVRAPGRGDYVFAVTCGSRSGPGTAETIVFPGRLVDYVFQTYTRRDQANEQRCFWMLTKRLQQSW